MLELAKSPTLTGNVLTGIERDICPVWDNQACINLKIVRNCLMNRDELQTRRRPQYRMLMSTSRGVLQIERRFFARNNRGESVISARRPIAKVTVASVRPITVKY